MESESEPLRFESELLEPAFSSALERWKRCISWVGVLLSAGLLPAIAPLDWGLVPAARSMLRGRDAMVREKLDSLASASSRVEGSWVCQPVSSASCLVCRAHPQRGHRASDGRRKEKETSK